MSVGAELGFGPLARIGHSEPSMYPSTDGLGNSGMSAEASDVARIPESHERLFENQVVLVFGGSNLDPRGIGAAAALRCAREGAAAVGITGSNKENSQGPLVRDQLEGLGAQGLWLPGDVKDPDAIAETIARM